MQITYQFLAIKKAKTTILVLIKDYHYIIQLNVIITTEIIMLMHLCNEELNKFENNRINKF